jgi:RNA polymerase sigma-70 factor, ECF subfamily
MDTLVFDTESAVWLRDLRDDGGARTDAIARLHAMLVRVARGEAERRRATLPVRATEEVDDVCVQAANDALLAILAKLDTYRGTARFTTWACKFVIFEASSRLRRLAWRERKVEVDDTIWDRLPDQTPTVLKQLEDDQLIRALHHAVDTHLTARQRLVFQSVTLEDVPTDVLAERLGTTRGVIYKTLHDARAKLRRALTDAGHAERAHD